MKNYELFWKDIHIGSVTETNWDMRSAGDIIYHFNYQEPVDSVERLAAFIRLSIRESQCYEDGLEEGDEFKAICKEVEEHFMDFVDSEEWYLLNEKQERMAILCPIFHINNEIVWQIDLEKLRKTPSNG
ncbi:hypothetical protein D3C87_41160 [compost metagenome]